VKSEHTGQNISSDGQIKAISSKPMSCCEPEHSIPSPHVITGQIKTISSKPMSLCCEAEHKQSSPHVDIVPTHPSHEQTPHVFTACTPDDPMQAAPVHIEEVTISNVMMSPSAGHQEEIPTSQTE